MPFNSIFAWVMKKRIHQIDLFRKYPNEVQHELLETFVELGATTEYGQLHNFAAIKNYADFQKIPLQTYEDVRPWVDRLMSGEQGLLWPSETKWFAKSS